MNAKLHEHPDLLVLSGSRLYGTFIESSDEDLRGCVIPPFEYIIGRKRWDQYESKEPDTVIYGVTKFMQLLEYFSPNIAEILFAPVKNIKAATPKGQILLDNRKVFVSKNAVKPMRGFAHSEWKKATEYFEQMRKLGASRKADIAAFGYSIKNAYHAVRLLDECLELLNSGNIVFPRHNAEYLRKIRLGQVDIEDVTAYYDDLKAKIDPAVAASSIPEETNKSAIDEIFYTLIGDEIAKFWKERNRSKNVFGCVEDGFGSSWPKCGRACSLHVVRPGKSQCNEDCPDCPSKEP